ncbi:hypothetical protein, partial [Staphylococcus aureus]|uniref:hypothetical protein n=1 Tax=Staphylococcus aureus TaxID=1280 RepID=UPI001ED99F9B
VPIREFNSYGSRRGNHEVMVRGTFANIRIKNQLAPGTEGGFTTYWPTNEVMPIFDAAMKYKEDGTGLVVPSRPRESADSPFLNSNGNTPIITKF